MTEPYNAKITHICRFYPTLVKKSTYTLKLSLKKWTFVITFVTRQTLNRLYDVRTLQKRGCETVSLRLTDRVFVSIRLRSQKS